MDIAHQDAYVTIRWNMEVEFRISTEAEGRQAVENMKFRKREVLLRKNEIELAMRDIRANYAAYARTRGPKAIGGVGRSGPSSVESKRFTGNSNAQI